MWPELCSRKLVTSPDTQTSPICCSNNRRTCVVSSLTDKTRRVCSVGNSSPKSHSDFELRDMVSRGDKVGDRELVHRRLRSAADRRIGIRQSRLQRRYRLRSAKLRVVERDDDFDAYPVVAVV